MVFFPILGGDKTGTKVKPASGDPRPVHVSFAGRSPGLQSQSYDSGGCPAFPVTTHQWLWTTSLVTVAGAAAFQGLSHPVSHSLFTCHMTGTNGSQMCDLPTECQAIGAP